MVIGPIKQFCESYPDISITLDLCSNNEVMRRVSDWGEERQLKWERHTEFSTFTFVARRHDDDYFSDLATEPIPSEWFHALEARRFVAVKMELVSGEAATPASENVRKWIEGSGMVGSSVLGSTDVFCDWIIKNVHLSGFEHALRRLGPG